ncbi:MAG TPA: glycosyltransferase, partial [Gemmatimonadales bacterium]
AWRLLVVGDGPERERLEALASARRLAARVRWVGSLPATQLSEVWPDLDVLVVPSRNQHEWRESAGHALAEAMAHEVAVIGTDAGVTPEVIGDAGIVVPPEDPDALAAAIGRMADPAVQRPLAAAARARALKAFSDDAVAERTVEFWRRVVE